MISIITVCHNSYRLLDDYVGSFLTQHATSASEGAIEFIFIENSGDLRTEEHASKLRDAGFNAGVCYSENRGFGAGCNVGAEAAQGDILVFANPDIEFTSSLLPLEAFFKDRHWGTVLQRDGKNRPYCFDLLPEHRSILSEILRIHHYLQYFKPLLGNRLFPIGSFFVVRKEIFQNVKGFDERFFLYFEEAELGRRLNHLVGPPDFLRTVSIFHNGLGTQPSTDFTFREEAKGFLTYCRVTAQPELISRRSAVLRLLSLRSRIAGERAQLIDELWKLENSQSNIEQ